MSFYAHDLSWCLCSWVADPWVTVHMPGVFWSVFSIDEQRRCPSCSGWGRVRQLRAHLHFLSLPASSWPIPGRRAAHLRTRRASGSQQFLKIPIIHFVSIFPDITVSRAQFLLRISQHDFGKGPVTYGPVWNVGKSSAQESGNQTSGQGWATDSLGCPGKVTAPLWALVYPSVKWGSWVDDLEVSFWLEYLQCSTHLLSVMNEACSVIERVKSRMLMH